MSVSGAVNPNWRADSGSPKRAPCPVCKGLPYGRGHIPPFDDRPTCPRCGGGGTVDADRLGKIPKGRYPTVHLVYSNAETSLCGLAWVRSCRPSFIPDDGVREGVCRHCVKLEPTP